MTGGTVPHDDLHTDYSPEPMPTFFGFENPDPQRDFARKTAAAHSSDGERMFAMFGKTIAALILAAFGLASASAWAANHNVTVGGSAGNVFVDAATVPATNLTTIAAGDTVTFTNAGGFHDVLSDPGAATSFTSGSASSDAWSLTVTFPTPGTVGYHCDIHGAPGQAMFGTITVQAATSSGNVPITPGFTGAWYDPTQSGHGIFLEVLPNNVLIAAWYTFTPDGTQQAWFVGTGPITNNTAVVSADLATGGAWIPNFDPTKIVNNPWGTLTFSFTDCNHGLVEFASTYLNYGTNHMNLARLTQPASLSCP
jgi:plastocyanin